MMRKVLVFLVLFLQILCSVGASTRNLDHAKDFAVYNQARNLNALPLNRSYSKGKKTEIGLVDGAGANKVINKMGSSPPNCWHKCYGCMPCEAIQVPTTTGRVRVQYTNYEPEGWKCKCGPVLYTP